MHFTGWIRRVMTSNLSLISVQFTKPFKSSNAGNDTLHNPNPWEFLIDKKHHLVWCNVFKAASTSWMYNFNLLAGYSPQFLKKSQVVPLTLARKKYPRPSVAQVSLLKDLKMFENLKGAFCDPSSSLVKETSSA